MGGNLEFFGMNSTCDLLAFNMFHNIAFKFPSVINHFLNLNHARYLRSNTNANDEAVLEAKDVLKRYIVYFSFLVKEILYHTSVKESTVECINDSLSKAIVLSKEQNIAERMFSGGDFEVMVTQLMYNPLQLYFLQSAQKNARSLKALTYKCDFQFREHIENPDDEAPNPEPDNCECPSIFGYIIPVDFFGSLFGLKPHCGKKYTHISYSNYEKQCERDECGNTEQWSRLKPIGYEVKSRTKTTLANMPDDKLSDTDKVCHQIHIPDRNNQEITSLEDPNCHIQVSEDFEIASDDGAHPLLECSEPEEDVKISKGLEDFLARAFSEKEPVILNVSNVKKTVCNPPCSVWCDSLDASSHTPDILNVRSLDLSSSIGIGKRNLDTVDPVYAVTVSTDDPQYLSYSDIQIDSESSCMSRNSIQVLSNFREDPMSLKVQNNKGRIIQSVSSTNQHGNYYNTSEDTFKQNVYLFQRNRRSTWSYVEDESSLWQSLPDCIPADDVARQYTQRRI